MNLSYFSWIFWLYLWKITYVSCLWSIHSFRLVWYFLFIYFHCLTCSHIVILLFSLYYSWEWSRESILLHLCSLLFYCFIVWSSQFLFKFHHRLALDKSVIFVFFDYFSCFFFIFFYNDLIIYKILPFEYITLEHWVIRVFFKG